MATLITAIYENGVFRPMEPLTFIDGETVQLAISSDDNAVRDWEQQLQRASNIDQWVALANACPGPLDEFDVVKEMDQLRRSRGERPLLPTGHPESK